MGKAIFGLSYAYLSQGMYFKCGISLYVIHSKKSKSVYVT